jgi:CorA-like Mg2+ transporter protein
MLGTGRPGHGQKLLLMTQPIRSPPPRWRSHQGLDERLDTLEQRVLREAGDDLTEITAIRHQAAAMRQTLTPGRDLAYRMPLILSLPGATPETQLYVENLNDELQRVVADLTAIEERCITLLGPQASLSGNHHAVVSRRLAAVATTFLPISFLAGFWERTSTSSPAPSVPASQRKSGAGRCPLTATAARVTAGRGVVASDQLEFPGSPVNPIVIL